MNAESQYMYINLQADITALESQQLQKQNDLTNLNRLLEDLENVQLPSAQKRLSDWMAAGDSDWANKQEKINASRKRVNELTAQINELKITKGQLETDIANLAGDIALKRAEQAAFVENYEYNLANGIDPKDAADQAADAAREAAQAAAAQKANESNKKTMLYLGIGGGLLLVIVVLVLIFKK